MVLRLLDLTGSADAEQPGGDVREEIIELIEADPAMSAQLLRLTNRDRPDAARTVRQAAEELGFDAVRSAVLSVGILETSDEAERSAGTGTCGEADPDRPAFRLHSLAVALSARMLAEHMCPAIDGEEAFVCGLLHDLGKLVLRQCLPRSYARVLEQARSVGGDVAEYERKIIGVDHTLAGRRLARLWRLPEAVEEVIWLHHQPFEAIPQAVSRRRLVGLVTLADAIARREGIGFSGNNAFGEDCEQLAGWIGIDPDVLSGVADRLAGQIERRAELLGRGQLAGRSVGCDALGVANAELVRLNDQLRRRVDSLARKAEAFARLRDFNAALAPDAPITDILRRIAAVMAVGGGASADSPGPVIAYAFAAEAGEVLAVRFGDVEASESRVLRRAEASSDDAPPDRKTPAVAVLAGLLDEPEAINDWVDPSACVHWPLVCVGKWIGGLFHSAAGWGATEEDRVIGDSLATTLAAALERSRAMKLSEQFAGASQLLAHNREALAEQKALAAVGEMAAGAAHELNNPLAVVSGRAQQMCKKARSEKSRKTWQLIADQAQQISDIISALMEFASPPSPKPTRVNVFELLQSAREAFSSSDHPQAASAGVDIAVGDDVPDVWVDREQLQAVIVELLTNAANAAEAGVNVRLIAEVDETDDAVLLTVADDGPGMDAATLARAFTPFFSAQRAGRRRGLGLSRAKRTVESNGGRMWIRSRPAEGTTVTIRLPAAGLGM